MREPVTRAVAQKQGEQKVEDAHLRESVLPALQASRRLRGSVPPSWSPQSFTRRTRFAEIAERNRVLRLQGI